MARHLDIPFTCNHVAHSLEYANTAARTGATGLTVDDVGRIAMQLDDDTFWILIDHSPVTWTQLGGFSAGMDDLDDVDTTTVSPTSGQHLEWNGSEWVPGELETPAAHTHTESDITDLDHYDSTDFDTDFGGADLADLGIKAHSSLTGIGADDHHTHSNKTQLDLISDGDHDVRTDNPHGVTAAQTGASATGHTHTHASTTSQGTDDHHAKSHAHNGSDGSGTVAHSHLTGVGANDHHTPPVQATETALGIAEIATQVETDAGIDDLRYVTPLKLATAPVASHTHAHSATTGQTANDHHNEDHGSRHASGGADSIKLDDLASPDDNTDLNATTSVHGLLPKLGGGTTNYLRADGTWTEPPGADNTSAVLLWGAKHIGSSTTTRYMYPGGLSSTPAQTSIMQFRIPRAGVLKNMRVRHNDPNGNGNTIVYTLRINSINSALTVSMASTASDGSDLSNTPSVAAGDIIDISITKASSIGGSPEDVILSVEFA